MARWFCILTSLVLCLSLAGCRTLDDSERPDRDACPPTPSNPYRCKVYIVQQGDTLMSIGRKFGVPWQKVLEDNPCSPNDLKVGRVLLIPVHLSTTAGPVDPPPEHGELPTASRSDVRTVSRQALHRGKPSHRFWWPTAGSLTRRYGDVVRGFKEPGIGLSASAGTEVCAVAAGTVICCVPEQPGAQRGWGNVIAIRHADGIVSWYGQLDRIMVRQHQQVAKGEQIGTVGASGAVAEPELAVRFFRNERPYDPLESLP